MPATPLPSSEDPRFKPLVQLNRWTVDGSHFEDFPHQPEANPGSFVVSLNACCQGGRGFRSPATSRDAEPPSGYVFYVDGDDRWAFWVGDGHYWSGVQGPPMEPRMTQLQGMYDAQLRTVPRSAEHRLRLAAQQKTAPIRCVRDVDSLAN
ncbi:MYND-type domain-containing protein [Durusdinium trenchii]|uniref:MYND-type domain-containing protein n=1 Tax=Durusdinium trenchii TaxID=1381693 RepID=A0ABP0KDJ1_9DINO